MSAHDPLPALAAHAGDTSLAHLRGLSGLRFTGPDAVAFLQAQLSSDVAKLEPGRLQRSTYLSPKGRVLANLLLWRGGDDTIGAIGAIVAADLAGHIAKRLAMFVLRAKVKVAAVPDRLCLGVAGRDVAALVASVLGRAPAPGEAIVHDDAVLLGLPDGRIIVDADPARADALRTAFTTRVPTADENAWSLAQVRAGAPLVTAATSDQFVPQALNLDALGAVSFQKGCYPGQEIVARTQYLGRLKERLYAFHADVAAPAAGTRLFAASFGEQACGMVINAANAEGRCELLAVVQRSAAETDTLRLCALDGPALARAELPYPLPEPAQPRGRIA